MPQHDIARHVRIEGQLRRELRHHRGGRTFLKERRRGIGRKLSRREHGRIARPETSAEWIAILEVGPRRERKRMSAQFRFIR